ncbi:MAG: hypothetical protein WBP59_14415, partial [Ilumatobacteraceae bacterium]
MTYRRLVDKICAGRGDVQVSDLSVAAVDEFEGGLLDRGGVEGGALSAKSVLAVHAVLYQILDDAVRRGVAAVNVAASAAPRAMRGRSSRCGRSTTFDGSSTWPAPIGCSGCSWCLLSTGLTRGEL